MPLYEYKCSDCDTKFDVLHKSTVNTEEVTCPKCNSNRSKKLISSFSASVSSDSTGSCSTGSCDLPENPYSGGCSSGMCGLN